MAEQDYIIFDPVIISIFSFFLFFWGGGGNGVLCGRNFSTFLIVLDFTADFFEMRSEMAPGPNWDDLSQKLFFVYPAVFFLLPFS